MGRYLDMAKALKGHSSPGLGYEINELNEITPPGETWGAAAASAKVVLLAVPVGVPGEWVQGVADLLAVACPASCPDAKWQALREDAYRFLSGWAAQAHRLGWTAFDLFGVHRIRPRARFDCMGLVPLLRGREVAALSEDQAAIKTANDKTLTYRRKIGPRPDGVCLLWKLGQ